MERSISDLLGIESDSQLRRVFNARAGGLITAIRAAKASGSGCKDEENDLATLTLALFKKLVQFHSRKDFKHRGDADEAIQNAAIKACSVAGDASRDILGSPYDYFSGILHNSFLNSATRGHHDTRLSELDGRDPDSAGTAAANITRAEQRSLHDEMTSEIGEAALSELIANNGFTPPEKKSVRDAMRHVVAEHPSWQKYQAKFEEYYLGQLLTPYFMRTWQAEMVAQGEPEGTFKRVTSDFKKALHHVLAESDAVLYEGGLDDKLHRIEEFRRTFHDDVPVAASQEREYISPTEMLERVMHTHNTGMHQKLFSLMTDMLAHRPEEEIRLDDGLALPARQVFIPHVPKHGGHPTILIDSKAVGFIEDELHYHHKRDDWLPLSRFNLLVGRNMHEPHRVETFNHFYELWKKNAKISIEGAQRPVRDYVGFFTPIRGHHAEFLTRMKLPEEIEGMDMYFSPLLKDYAQEHLPLPPTQEQESWMRIRSEKRGKGILRALHLSGRGQDGRAGVATYLAVLMKIEELYSQKSIAVGDPPVERLPKELMGKFMVDGKHSPLEQGSIWLVHPDLVGDGKPINHDDIKQQRDAMLADPDQFPRFKEALAAQGAGAGTAGGSGGPGSARK